ncbi:MAG: AAA family ATPase [Deltaproteobacteria bacterium]|nr:AAA family ATPase [Deltaproteobacteria bacterium]
MEKKRLSTGILGLDPLIEGGLTEGKSYLITGESGTGKSIFCMQFILKGLTDGEKAVYVAVDERPSDILEEAAALGWDLLKYIEQKSLLILDASPLFSARMGAGGKEKEVDVQKTVGDLASHVRRMGATRVVIDPVGPLILSRDSSARAQEHVRTLVHSLQDNMGTTNLLTSYAVPAIAGAGEGGVEEFLVAGVIILSFVRVQSRLVRTLLVRKMRGTAIDLMEHQFNIVKEKGIVLKPVL